MIKSVLFIKSFDESFIDGARLAGLDRQRSKTSKWLLKHDSGDLQFQFRVNQKASAIPYCPGEFWAEVSWNGQRYNSRDDGMVSYYQYTSDTDNEKIQALDKVVIAKVRSQETFENESFKTMRDISLGTIDIGLNKPPEPRFPNYPLYYLDSVDASAWGVWFASNIGLWIYRFQQVPETLEAWSWRVLWKDLPPNT